MYSAIYNSEAFVHPTSGYRIITWFRPRCHSVCLPPKLKIAHCYIRVVQHAKVDTAEKVSHLLILPGSWAQQRLSPRSWAWKGLKRSEKGEAQWISVKLTIAGYTGSISRHNRHNQHTTTAVSSSCSALVDTWQLDISWHAIMLLSCWCCQPQPAWSQGIGRTAGVYRVYKAET